MKDIIKSAIYGFAVGDALGVPVEFSKREYLKNNPVIDFIDNPSRRTPKGFWSDDTAMTLCTMQSIIDCNEINHEDMMNKYLKWFEEGFMTPDGKCFGIGQNTLKTLSNYKKSKSFAQFYIENGRNNEKAGGNGALMRILPIVLFLYNNDLKKYNKDVQNFRKYDLIEFNVGMTHNLNVNNETCVFYTMLVFNLIKYKDLKKAYEISCDETIKWYSGCPSTDLKRILLKTIINEDENNIKSSGYVVDSMEASIWCLFNTNSYEEAVLKAINLGGDTDTIGAITGSLAGIYYGLENIPDKWFNNLLNKDLIDATINKFINVTLSNIGE